MRHFFFFVFVSERRHWQDIQWTVFGDAASTGPAGWTVRFTVFLRYMLLCRTIAMILQHSWSVVVLLRSLYHFPHNGLMFVLSEWDSGLPKMFITWSTLKVIFSSWRCCPSSSDDWRRCCLSVHWIAMSDCFVHATVIDCTAFSVLIWFQFAKPKVRYS